MPPLDRQTIEKKDFPIGRRGYDPDAVDSHLAELAEEFDALRRQTRQRSENLASIASDQVRAIVEAAEQSAAEITREAEDDAAEIRAAADADARAAREQATDQARDYVGQVSEASASLLQRVDAMQGELDSLTEGLRTGTNRLNADLQLLEGNLSEVRDATGAGRRFEPEAPPPGPAPLRAAPTPEPAPRVLRRPTAPAPAAAAAEQVEQRVQAPAAPEPEPEPVFEDEYEYEPEAQPVAATNGASEDSEGARLVALNMALNGSSREETDQYLAEHFSLGDRDGLLDEVYETVEG